MAPDGLTFSAASTKNDTSTAKMNAHYNIDGIGPSIVLIDSFSTCNDSSKYKHNRVKLLLPTSGGILQQTTQCPTLLKPWG